MSLLRIALGIAVFGILLGAIVGVAVGAGWRFGWIGRCTRVNRLRRHKPMPLQRRSPAHERPSRPLTGCENIRFNLLAESAADKDLVADDPMEQR